MKYDITKPSAPVMPKLGKGTECIKILLSQVSKSMHAPLVPMLFPILGAHVSGSEFQYPDLTWKELCGQMANLVAESGGNKGQLSHLVEAICRDFRLHDEVELRKLVEWQNLTSDCCSDVSDHLGSVFRLPSAASYISTSIVRPDLYSTVIFSSYTVIFSINLRTNASE